MIDAPSTPTPLPARALLSKVPQVTIFFWVIKVLCTTVGETASDFLNINMGLGLTGTSVAAAACLAALLVVQFRVRKYTPAIYWLVVVLISVFGTLITDILTDSLHFPLEASTVIFSVALGVTFAVWYAKERTLSIHSIFTPRREAFYWLAILFTFALGTATGDLVAEKLGLGYLVTGLIVLGVIAASGVAARLGLHAVLAFWIAYILTRPLGASLGDYLSQARADGGLGLGATVTSAVFLVAILGVVVYLALTRRDVTEAVTTTEATPSEGRGPIMQVAVVVALLVGLGVTGYYVRSAQLTRQAAASSSSEHPLGDLSTFRALAQSMLTSVRTGDLSASKAQADALERAWDEGQPRLKPMNPDKWASMDGAIDDVLKKTRSSSEDVAVKTASLTALVGVIDAINRVNGAAPPAAGAPNTASGVSTSARVVDGGRPVIAPRPDRPLGDLSAFRAIAEDMLSLVRAGGRAGVNAKADSLEQGWDEAQARLKPMNSGSWTRMDDAIDDVLKKTRRSPPDPATEAAALTAFVAVIDALDPAR
jgi:uncharacterized membrane-anchored protein